jgi:hypothetical protein
MGLDAVHIDEVAAFAGRIARSVDDEEHDALAETVWDGWLDPLTTGGRTVLAPLGEQRLRSVATEDIALIDRPYPTSHGIDSGTINPTAFKNGLVLDIAQAAMGATPSDLDLHRSRSLVATVHTNDPTTKVDEDWATYDDGHSRRLVTTAPQVDRYADVVVHALSLYLAEGSHARQHVDRVEDLLVLDGPLYPKQLFTWKRRYPELSGLLADTATPATIIENYVRLVETCIERDVPVVGFVKTPSPTLVTHTLREKADGIEAPWNDDIALFRRLLERYADGGRRTDVLTCTNWFVSRGGADRPFASDGDPLGVRRDLDPAAYEVTFFVCYDPRTDVCYRIEAPRAVTDDPDRRERLTRHLLSEIAGERGPPAAIQRADELARISRDGKAALGQKLERAFDSEQVHTYDEHRWDDSA